MTSPAARSPLSPRRKQRSTDRRIVRRKMFFETLDERRVMATSTAGAGPGGFEVTNSATSLALWLDASDINGDNAPDALVTAPVAAPPSRAHGDGR